MRILFLEEIEKQCFPMELDGGLITLEDRTKKTYGGKSVVLPDATLKNELWAIQKIWAPDSSYNCQIRNFINRYKEAHSGKGIDVIVHDLIHWKTGEKFKDLENVEVFFREDYIHFALAEDLLKNDPDYPLKHPDYWNYITRNIK